MYILRIDKELIIPGIPLWLALIASLFVSPGTALLLVILSILIGIPVMVNIMENYRIRKAIKRNKVKLG